MRGPLSTSTPTSRSGSTMASDIDKYRRVPPCALHRTFLKKFNRPNYTPEKTAKIPSTVNAPSKSE